MRILLATTFVLTATLEYMTADQLGPDVNVDRLNHFPVEHIDGYGFGLGVAGIMGSSGEFHWSGS